MWLPYRTMQNIKIVTSASTSIISFSETSELEIFHDNYGNLHENFGYMNKTDFSTTLAKHPVESTSIIFYLKGRQ